MRLKFTARRAVTRRPIRLRLTLVYSGLFLLAGVVLLTITYALVADSLTAKAAPIALAGATTKLSIPGDLPGTAQPRVKPFASADASGEPSGKPSMPPGAMDVLALCKKGLATQQQRAKCKSAAQAAYASGAKAGADAARSNTLDHLLYISLGALGGTALLSALLGWVVAGRALRPVHAITAAARRASEENLSERIALDGPSDELKDLADTFDAMLARLDAAFASQRRFVANASHELRTPLTVMRTAIDVTLAKPQRSPAQLEAMAAEVQLAATRAEALIEALLTLARSDRGQGPRSPFDLAVLAEDAPDAAVPGLTAASLQVTTRLHEAQSVGDPVLVQRLVANLIDNAVRHNVLEGWIDVTTGSRDGMAFLSVANGGPLIPKDEVSSLFEPFRRLAADSADPMSEGVGLGLSIARSVVTAHQGEVTARAREDGGLEVWAFLPAPA
jgi:signal transduction histidine kinase